MMVWQEIQWQSSESSTTGKNVDAVAKLDANRVVLVRGNQSLLRSRGGVMVIEEW